MTSGRGILSLNTAQAAPPDGTKAITGGPTKDRGMSTQVVLITGGLTGIGPPPCLRQEGREGGRCRSA
jgi:hypothetical protein